MVLRGPERQATNQSAIRVAYAKVDYTVAFSLDKLFIPKMINQMSNSTIDMFNHLAQRVNELEMKG